MSQALCHAPAVGMPELNDQLCLEPKDQGLR